MTQNMRRPPEPLYSFTIPSVHDDTTLDCRIYHPNILNKPAEADSDTTWKKSGIIMGHPYAPMGGSYDDRVVGIAVDEFLKAGWIVGTFNFRGAHTSKGRTSWSGKPESDDYASFAAFFMHYMCYLEPFPPSDAVFDPEQSPISPQAHRSSKNQKSQREESPIVVLGGYSYGSLILKHLPPVPTMLQPFATPLSGSAADEVILRARKLADQSNLEWINLARNHEREKTRRKETHKHAVSMGGEETSPDKRRSSRDIRRSFDGRRSLEVRTALRSLSHRRRKDEGPTTPPQEVQKPSIIMPTVRYLLISPLTPPISTIAAPALGRRFWHRAPEGEQEVIGKHPALAIYGDQDVFSSAKKLRDWSQQLKAQHGSQFTGIEVEGAGHFWVEKGVEGRMRTALREWEGTIRI
ncbi:hypothetical protein IQ07DRAFT_674788 [Pyrenochaeta sp. DS3sAY3a]|nr:hypothetical protein IQ07DRAFT_674788 [Pyrenochaeta sp. DS3sAY3a]